MSSFNSKTRIFSSFTPKSEFSMTPSMEKRKKTEEKKTALSYRRSLESKNREKRWVMTEHLKQIKNLNRKVAEIGNLPERKKKGYDMIGHPVLFLRGKSQKDPRLKDKFIGKVLKRPEKIRTYEAEICDNKTVEVKRQKEAKDLARLLLDAVVTRRLYRSRDLNDFFDNVRSNCVLEQDLIEDAIALVINKLEM